LGFVCWAMQSACSTPVDPGDSAPSDDDAVVDAEILCEGIEGEGYAEGDISMDWSLKDIDGKSVSLYDYCGQVIYIEDTTAW
jgi:hypothetical protein